MTDRNTVGPYKNVELAQKIAEAQQEKSTREVQDYYEEVKQSLLEEE